MKQPNYNRIRLFYKAVYEEGWIFDDLCEYWDEADDIRASNVLRGIFYQRRKTVFASMPQSVFTSLLGKDNTKLVDMFIDYWCIFLSRMMHEYESDFNALWAYNEHKEKETEPV